MKSHTASNNTLSVTLAKAFSSKWLRRALWGTIPLLAVVSFYATSKPADPIDIKLSAEPLYAKGAGAKPTLSLALSVEFPTVGAQFRDEYIAAEEYIGYYDTNSCYGYDNAATTKHFYPIGLATNHACGGTGFSGNFMNWATSSAIDVLRLGLTGGDRIQDDASMTILQRAIIPESDWDGKDGDDGDLFPKKTLPASMVSGALPNTLKGTFTGDVKIANCLNRVHFGTNATGSCNSPDANSNLGTPVNPAANSTVALTTDNFFYTRVKVCNTDSGRADSRITSDYCLKYPDGNYKPVGNLQKYSDLIRVAAFGYLNDSTESRYGGVLRAPMKFLGSNTYNSNGTLIGPNANIEWDAKNGIFIPNPDSAAEGISGVINYLNRFGRTGSSPGVYKGFDPISELYYEVLRYVQGLPATAAATDGMTPDMKDGYPVYGTATNPWVDPHAGGNPKDDYSCLKNNIIVIGDTYTHADKNIPGNKRVYAAGGDTARSSSLAANEPNFYDWTKVVGGFESNNAVSYPFGTLPTSQVTSNPNAAVNTARWGMEDQPTGSKWKNSAAYYMAGMAYWGNSQDIRGKTWTAEPSKQRPGMRTKTYVIDVNENGANSVASVRQNTQLFLTAKYGGFTDASGKGNPFLDDKGAIDNNNWQKSAEPGEPKTYYLASSAKAVLAGINEIFKNIASEGNSIANGSISTTSFAKGGYTYSAKFYPKDWSGDVLSYPVSAPDGNVSVDVGSPQWSASMVMNANPNNYFTDKRNVLAGGSKGNNGGVAAIDFNWSGVSSDEAMLAALKKSSPTAAPDSLAKDRMNYLRGDKSKENTVFRPRVSLLGDIVNSPVVYSKEFGDNINTTAYKTFKTDNASRPGALFVGANDGMFHAFDVANGKELFAYIPSWLASKLPALTDPTYKHQSYVDGATDVAEALVGSAWKTVLVSSTGGGGQGVFALDVSNPANFKKDQVMWEFTDRDDRDLGNVMGVPKIVKMQTNKKTSTEAPRYDYFAIVPSGVNNFVADDYPSTSLKPHLFILSLNKAPGTKWVKDTNYYKIEIETDDVLSKTVSPGVINFDAITGAADEIDQLYMGDLHGNLWKFDFDTASYAKALNAITFTDLTGATTSKPLFVAKDHLGNEQPITMTPKLVYGPNKSTIVMFGTGKYLETSDNSLTPVRTQSVYAINDVGGTPAVITGRDLLQKGTAEKGVVTMPSFVWGRAARAGDTTQRSGWYFDLPTSGERQIGDFVTSSTNLYFGTVVPPQNVNDPCGGGSGNIYALNFATGSGSSATSTVGLVGQIFVQETIDALISETDSTGRRSKTTTKRLLIKGSGGFATPPENTIESSYLGRLSWRQINNYNELNK